jgi:hypothetical protein
VINEAEAATVRTIFAKFVELKSVQGTLRWLRSTELRTKVRQREGRTVGGAQFHYGALRCVLGNPLYVGKVPHKGKIHEGQHQPIVEREVFDQARWYSRPLAARRCASPAWFRPACSRD